MFQRLLLLGLLIPISAASLQADTISKSTESISFYSGDFGTGSLEQFDTSLGVLNKVELTFSFSASGFLTSTASEDIGSIRFGIGGMLQVSPVEATVSFPPVSNATIDTNPTTIPASGSAISSTISVPFVSVSPVVAGTPSEFEGTGTLNFTVTGTLADASVVLTNIANTVATFDSFNGTVTATYYFTPIAVPEPSSYAMLAVVGVFGALAYRRRQLAIAA